MTETQATYDTDVKDAKGKSVPMIQVVNACDIKNPWICNTCGAIMGSVFHEKIRQGLSITRLILFRGSVKIDEQLPANFIFGKVDAGEFGCSRCGEVRRWHPSHEALQYLNEGKGHLGKRNRNV